MKRTLLKTNAFVRSAKRIIRKDHQLANQIRETLILLSEDAFHPYLKTHKLKGNLEGSWACSVGYDLRIVFEFVSHKDGEAVLLEAIGTHNEVY
ncbi:MAG: type II toxin-antitoxin system mRNA interferase toxin, RelE/StbE family [Desulfococcaceae bacterium]|jgi:addiction module RelE/StbE family toxin|nr:type II toxin-antitoxin system mRNA interferase toxin, RelE/StbE family [Desulfococcaceae bacterium]